MNGNRVVLVALELFLGLGAVGGAIWVVPTLPLDYLAGSSFGDYAVPAFALGAVGGGAICAAGLLLLRARWGARLSVAVGLAIAIFEVVETSVVGWDVWLYAAGLRASVGRGLPATDLVDVPVLLGVPLPLWLQPFYFALGFVIALQAMRLHGHSEPGRGRNLGPGHSTAAPVTSAVAHA